MRSIGHRRPSITTAASVCASIAVLGATAFAPMPTAEDELTLVPSFVSGTPLPAGIEIAGEDTAYLLGSVSFGEGGVSPRLLFRTDDQGATWLPATPPGVNFGRITARDSETVVAHYGGVVRATTDGAATWRSLPRIEAALDGTNSGDIDFDADGTLWVSSAPFGSCGRDAPVLLRSDDLGDSITPVGLPAGLRPAGVLGGPSGSVLVRAIDCTDESFTVLASGDDGHHWEEVPALTDTLSEFNYFTDVRWIDEDTVLTWEGRELRVLTGFATAGDPELEEPAVLVSSTHSVDPPRTLTGIDPLEQSIDVEVAGTHVLLSTGQGALATARIEDGALVDITTVVAPVSPAVIRTPFVFPDGSVLTILDLLTVERELD